ncbi:MAG: Rrf2 family transcriptional regulator [Planctomycetes bacterium]|nr:Rrf2 family transcriptional regulator [Planctomycetota bacterium]
MLSQTVEYALRAMTHLAALPRDAAANSETIAARTRVPKGYLSKVLRDLVVAGLIDSRRGPSGGFALARPASEVSILDVVNAADPIRRIERCPLGNPAHVKLCPLHRRLDDSIAMIEREFARTSLAEVIETSVKSSDSCPSLVGLTVRAKPVARGKKA